MTMPRDPLLDPEERELAAQLARIAPHGEPSADLDARILAMAERGLAGVSPVSAPHRRRPQRWPVWLGLAASLTVVAGLVWQLQPVMHPRETVSYEAPARVAADIDPNGKRQPIDYVESAAAEAAMPPPPPPVEVAQTPHPPANAIRPPPQDAPVAMAVSPVAPPPAPPPAPAEANAAMQADAAAAKTMAADRAMAQEAPRRPVPSVAEARATSAPALAAPVAAPAAAARARQPSISTMQAADAVMMESAPPPEQDRAGFDARPPLTADTPEVQRNWLARIRELRDAGELEEARQSLAAFARRNPKAEIPADLKPLLPAAPAAPAPSSQP